ncbi:MAG: DUF4435 domain-containing protein [Candidatus Riflebacteria bacterium]|nr:DUF4435 domain-containing protein [Candidatus Riflebacteria bacterium]
MSKYGNTMKDHITIDRAFNSTLMLRKTRPGTILILEGDTDARFFRNLIEPTRCQIVISHSKDNAIKVLNKLIQNKIPGILAIVDNDYWVVENKVISDPNLIPYDFHDFEILQLLSPAFPKYMAEVIPADQLAKCEQVSQGLLKAVFQLGVQIGFVRWVNDHFQFYFSFENLPYQDFCDFANLTVDFSKLLKILFQLPNKCQKSKDEVRAEIESKMSGSHDPRYVCQGHDCMQLLKHIAPIIANKYCGREVGQTIFEKLRHDNSERGIRLAYEYKHFQATDIHKLIQEWEKRNSYQVLR